MDQTLSEAKKARLAELRGLGMRFTAQELRGELRQITDDWWRSLEEAAWAGQDIAERVWRAARRDHAPGCIRLWSRWNTARSQFSRLGG